MKHAQAPPLSTSFRRTAEVDPWGPGCRPRGRRPRSPSARRRAWVVGSSPAGTRCRRVMPLCWASGADGAVAVGGNHIMTVHSGLRQRFAEARSVKGQSLCSGSQFHVKTCAPRASTDPRFLELTLAVVGARFNRCPTLLRGQRETAGGRILAWPIKKAELAKPLTVSINDSCLAWPSRQTHGCWSTWIPNATPPRPGQLPLRQPSAGLADR